MGPRHDTILVVEDDVDLVDAVADALRSRGFSVLTANDGAMALDVLNQHTPSAILLDLCLPRVDGFAFLAARAERPELTTIPVIIASGTPPLRDLAASTWNEYIAKPYTVEALVAVIERACGRRRAAAACP